MPMRSVLNIAQLSGTYPRNHYNKSGPQINADEQPENAKARREEKGRED
jgi:hypothetical protein